MIDTNTVNFAVTKMSQAWQSAAPQLANVSEEYIRFVVMKAVLTPAIAMGFLVTFVVLAVITNKKIDTWDVPSTPAICLVLSYCVCFITTIVFVCSVYSALLAINCPEMFTVHQLLQAAK